jgi:hypothetical protein
MQLKVGPAAALNGLGGWFWSIGLFSVFVNLLMLTGPLYMLQVYDRVLGSRSKATLVALTLLIAALYAIMGLLDHARSRVAARRARGRDDVVAARRDGVPRGPRPRGRRNSPMPMSLTRRRSGSNRPLNTRRQAAFGAASRSAFHVQGSSSSRRLGSWVRMRPRMSVR